MFKMITKILGVIALTGWMGAANATLIFDFSWNSANGTVTGEILGLVDNTAGQAATGLKITSVAGIYGGRPEWNIFDSSIWDAPAFNDFDVVGGAITRNEFLVYSPSLVGVLDLWTNRWGYRSPYDPTIFIAPYPVPTFVNRVTVPEPSSIILMLLGLAGLSFARYRKQY
ncbi:PEP-CTERM sorting domain-containing protein [Paraglaciecola sp. MB-3u-78]|uniref:PEP-CTERM sorting domain-containing protein n=1 Tax=Paraglaciecola sp. MB-3u-78 TaxID=2058332 RepID=UPI000C322C1C|nr:PEP-CTERM sorting domain-containing protein [Paraglaciecola sp. MB-3u-78]PKG97582.1 hypothetical protein CXF95_19810 [Paraglaciecola sp. MB-3u-78]